MKPTEPPSRTDLMYEIVYNPKFVPVKSPKVSVKTTSERGQNTYLIDRKSVV